MESEKKYDREILKAFLNKQIYRCVNNKYYILGILLLDVKKNKLIKQILDELLKQKYSKYIQRFDYSSSRNCLDNMVIFNNGSRIDFGKISETTRGKRYHSLILDSNITDEVKFCIGYAKIIPYPPMFVLGKDIKNYKQLTNKTDIIEIDIR